MTTKARIKAGEEIVGKKWEEKFLQSGTRMQILFKKLQKLRSYRSETDYSFFFFFTPTMIHYSWTRDFTDKKGTIQD